jgi:hypothetical protein
MESGRTVMTDKHVVPVYLRRLYWLRLGRVGRFLDQFEIDPVLDLVRAIRAGHEDVFSAILLHFLLGWLHHSITFHAIGTQVSLDTENH